MLFLGNSITLHPPAEGMSGSWGMAASSAEKDYVHLVLDAVGKRNGNKPEAKVLNLADFERGFEQYDIAAKLKAEIEFQADTMNLRAALVSVLSGMMIQFTSWNIGWIGMSKRRPLKT